MAPKGQPQRWDAATFSADLAQAKVASDREATKKLLAKVAEHNYFCKDFWMIPRTVPVNFEECRKAKIRAHAKAPRLSISTMTTAEACFHFARDKNNVVCALNFANGQTAGGGYKSGATAQEEDLCRQCPTLYSTLYNATKEGLYPFGPATCKDASHPAKYSDVLYTSGLVVARGSMEDGYPFVDEVTVSMVAAAAPNIRFAKEISEAELIYNTVQSIFVAPRLTEPEVNTLILGAWGCGAFGGDPKQIAELFVRALMSDSYGELYQEIHFAIPKLAPSDVNYDVFAQVLSEFKLEVADLDKDLDKGATNAR
jgi:uncharacterized protein (TIGR02452 family)